MHKKLVGACLALTMGAGAGYALTAMAQQKPEDVIKYRKAVMVVQSWNMRPMALMVKGQQPYDAQLFAWYAGVIQQTSNMLPDAFAAGSDKGDTKAKPEIWSEPAKSKAALVRSRLPPGPRPSHYWLGARLDHVPARQSATRRHRKVRPTDERLRAVWYLFGKLRRWRG